MTTDSNLTGSYKVQRLQRMLHAEAKEEPRLENWLGKLAKRWFLSGCVVNTRWEAGNVCCFPVAMLYEQYSLTRLAGTISGFAWAKV